AVPGNIHQVETFRAEVVRLWYGALRRRGQRHRLTWQRMRRHAERWLPPVRITHPCPTSDSTLAPKSGAQCVSSARWDLRGGPPARAVPTAIVPNVDVNDALEMSSTDDQEVVEAVSAHGTHPPLRVGVRVRCPHRRPDHPDALRTEDLVEPAPELRVAVVDQQPEPLIIAQPHHQVASLLRRPTALRVRRARDVPDPSRRERDEQQHVD